MKADRLLGLLPIIGLLGSSIALADPSADRRLEADVRFLADDLLEGRGTPSRGLDVAAVYLANALRAAGWRPGNGGSYLQTYEVQTFSPKTANRVVKLHGVELDPKDFVLLTVGDPAAATGRFDLVYAGYGIAFPEKKRDDFGKVDLREKGVVALFGAPWPMDPDGFHDCDRAVGKGLQAGVRGARVLIYVDPELDSPTEKPASTEVAILRQGESFDVSFLGGLGARKLSPLAPTALLLKPSAFDRVLARECGGSYAELARGLATGNPTLARPIKAQVEIRLDPRIRSGKASNVVAVLPGSDPTLKDEWIVLSGHYDHLGMSEELPGPDPIFNGADDNASGSAALLEVARRLAAGPAPKRSVLVLLASGEEPGLLGSEFFSLHPLVPPEKIVADINLDMVGRSSGSVQALAPMSADLFRAAGEAAGPAGIRVEPDLRPDKRLIYFIDGYHFARLGVPVLELFTATHADYHQPGDEADKIDYARLGQITEVAYRLADRYAQAAPRPAYVRPAWFLTPE